MEAFGNAKTIRNDNSSRFGKYMEIVFDYRAVPFGGRITNYLLEKVRVVKRSKSERSFHIFYMMLAGLKDDELRQLGLVAEVFTDGGRAARYRHYARHKFDFSETQFAVLCELLLRGRQQPGELRTRASRMFRIDSQEHLKADLVSLQSKGFVQSNGPLERRGVEVDHTFYLPKENMTMAAAVLPADDEPEPRPSIPAAAAAPTALPSAPHSSAPLPAMDSGLLHGLQSQLSELNSQMSAMQSLMDSLQQRLERIERDLGV